MERYRGLVDLLESSLAETDVDMARAELRTLFGSIRVVSDEREVRFEADLRGTQATLLRAVGASANNVVAPIRERLSSGQYKSGTQQGASGVGCRMSLRARSVPLVD